MFYLSCNFILIELIVFKAVINIHFNGFKCYNLTLKCFFLIELSIELTHDRVFLSTLYKFSELGIATTS